MKSLQEFMNETGDLIIDTYIGVVVDGEDFPIASDLVTRSEALKIATDWNAQAFHPDMDFRYFTSSKQVYPIFENDICIRFE